MAVVDGETGNMMKRSDSSILTLFGHFQASNIFTQ